MCEKTSSSQDRKIIKIMHFLWDFLNTSLFLSSLFLMMGQFVHQPAFIFIVIIIYVCDSDIPRFNYRRRRSTFQLLLWCQLIFFMSFLHTWFVHSFAFNMRELVEIQRPKVNFQKSCIKKWSSYCHIIQEVRKDCSNP